MAQITPDEMDTFIKQFGAAVNLQDAVEILKNLLNNGSMEDVNNFLQGHTKITPTQVEGTVNLLLVVAVGQNRIDVVQFLVETKGANANNAMETAAVGGHIQCLRYLIQKGAGVNPAGEGPTPLQLAARSGWVNCVKQLLQAGVHVNTIQNNPDRVGQAPVSAANISMRSAPRKLLFLSGGDVNPAEFHSPLFEAVRSGKVECVKLLLEHGADVNFTESHDQTALAKATIDSNLECVKLLLEAGADVNKADQHQRTTLTWAATLSNLACMNQLLEAGADVNKEDLDGQTPLFEAAYRGDALGVQLLLEAGASVNVADRGEGKLLWAAAWGGDATCMDLLLKAGAQLNTTTRTTTSPLRVSVCESSVKCLQLLVKAGADVNEVDCDGDTALWTAARKGDTACTKLLLETGADVNMTDQNGETVLMEAASLGRIQCMKLVLAAGAQVNRQTCPTLQKRNANKYTQALLLFASGQENIKLQSRNQRTVIFYPSDWENLDMRNQCRKAIRKHLLTLDPHTNFFIRVPQLKQTTEKAGLPKELVSYLLYEQELNVE